MSIGAKRSAISATAELLLNKTVDKIIFLKFFLHSRTVCAYAIKNKPIFFWYPLHYIIFPKVYILVIYFDKSQIPLR